jgi:hypothetical protein
MNFTTVIGLLAAFCTTFSYYPQLKKCLLADRSSGVMGRSELERRLEEADQRVPYEMELFASLRQMSQKLTQLTWI